MSLLSSIADGNLPEVPFKVTVDDQSIIKIAVAAIMVALIIIFANALVKTKK